MFSCISPYIPTIREPREYANDEHPNPKYFSGADLKVLFPETAVVFDHTIIHAASVSNIKKPVKHLYEAVIHKKNDTYMSRATDAGELFHVLPVLSSCLI